MNTNARLGPAEYVDKLMNLQVPGYKGEPNGRVKISAYLSGNPMFGGAANANLLSSYMRTITTRHADGTFNRPGFSRIFNGQGDRDNFVAAMTLINNYQDEFKAEKALAKYFKNDNFLQAMIDDNCFGLDCVGFVGGWVVEACLESAFVNRRPLDFAALFQPVKSLTEVTDNSVIMMTSGLHIQVIDYVKARDGNRSITVDLCQSTAGGPQTNVGVTIHSGGGSYLPVGPFRAAMADPKEKEAWAADNADRATKGEKPRDFETYLRSKLTQSGVKFGYMGGAIFIVTPNGNPRTPMAGSVYIGNGGVTVGPPM